jgi:hypothetical protein
MDALSLHDTTRLPKTCLRNPPSHASCATVVSDTVRRPERGCLDWIQTPQSAARSQRVGPMRTCVAPATVPFIVCLRRALWCSVTTLPSVVRRLREERIASRRCIRVGRGREGYVQRLLTLLCLRCLLRLLWLRRGRIGRVRVGGRRLVIRIMDRMAVRRARERLLAGVHGAAGQFGSSSTRAGKCPRMQREEECRLRLALAL